MSFGVKVSEFGTLVLFVVGGHHLCYVLGVIVAESGLVVLSSSQASKVTASLLSGGGSHLTNHR